MFSEWSGLRDRPALLTLVSLGRSTSSPCDARIRICACACGARPWPGETGGMPARFAAVLRLGSRGSPYFGPRLPAQRSDPPGADLHVELRRPAFTGGATPAQCLATRGVSTHRTTRLHTGDDAGGFGHGSCCGYRSRVDLETLEDRATYDDPHQHSRGTVHVIVNGQLAFRDGSPTGVLAGQPLRRRGWQPHADSPGR
jgi:hypothetical protein